MIDSWMRAYISAFLPMTEAMLNGSAVSLLMADSGAPESPVY